MSKSIDKCQHKFILVRKFQFFLKISFLYLLRNQKIMSPFWLLEKNITKDIFQPSSYIFLDCMWSNLDGMYLVVKFTSTFLRQRVFLVNHKEERSWVPMLPAGTPSLHNWNKCYPCSRVPGKRKLKIWNVNTPEVKWCRYKSCIIYLPLFCSVFPGNFSGSLSLWHNDKS